VLSGVTVWLAILATLSGWQKLKEAGNGRKKTFNHGALPRRRYDNDFTRIAQIDANREIKMGERRFRKAQKDFHAKAAKTAKEAKKKDFYTDVYGFTLTKKLQMNLTQRLRRSQRKNSIS
jgi:hypothetical protein